MAFTAHLRLVNAPQADQRPFRFRVGLGKVADSLRQSAEAASRAKSWGGPLLRMGDSACGSRSTR